MEVNVTVVLQALQFACAYCFLYKLLFVPACKILDAEEQFKKDLYQKLEQEQQIKDALSQDYQVKNNAFKQVLLQAIPELSTQLDDQKSIVGSTLYHAEQAVLSQESRQETESFLVNHLSQVIKK